MNTPNKLTILRVIMVPFFMLFLLVDKIPGHMIFALALFILASITDLIDGKLARKYNQITNFGKLMDPLADKLLVTSALICFVATGLADVWAVFLIIAREFLVTSIRLIAAGSGKVIPANIWGKIKTNSQIIAIVAVMVFSYFSLPAYIGSICVWISAVFTVISGVQYAFTYREYLSAAN
ncbi:CDP-diacylglycerol/glycerol-3-phosphate 3-phosphatidyltransferase [[Clostridium] cellulosi]|jgi:CDP-diacylglycerol--glycerol-3-phosphate 3-phosphatidyltransferase|uniref:CDP-diacylglycerol--glycerol-3-phosphate 3-phosphatidyltransferase n=1 Tax=[Clostridium] cellulosi TaxID=29343 RepID=A0A078KQH6_9FIRM|nr:MAG: CDP-diacylglycerol--glycerol-3-phosphate 3-phosphatidyltransferase [[Clostridium] cellulosi]CDZ24792.1 CDP-diacylglycerol/glycerol-3-phosphate 3-phosphatidyltransferase [[Clostridium] cellulosi]